VLPIATLDASKPAPVVVKGYEGGKIGATFGATAGLKRRGATVIVPQTVSPISFERVLFWMQGERLPDDDSGFLSNLLPVAQQAGALIVVMRSVDESVQDRVESLARFVSRVLREGVYLPERGQIRVNKRARYLLGGWSRGGTAAICVAAGLSTTKLPDVGRLTGVVVVGAGGIKATDGLYGRLTETKAAEAVRHLDALFVQSYADGDTGVDSSALFSTFGTGSGRCVLITSYCQNHRSLLDLRALDSDMEGGTYCPETGSNQGVFLPARPPCFNATFGTRWVSAVTGILLGESGFGTTDFQRLFDGSMRVDPALPTTLTVQGGSALVPSSVAAKVSGKTPMRVLQDVRLDGRGLSIHDLLEYFEPGFPVTSTNGCPTMSTIGGSTLAFRFGARGVAFVAPAGGVATLEFGGPFPEWRLGSAGVFRIGVGLLDLDLLRQAASGLSLPNTNPRFMRTRVCVGVKLGEGVTFTVFGSRDILSRPAYQREYCTQNVDIPGCPFGSRVVQEFSKGLIASGSPLVLQTAALPLVRRPTSGLVRLKVSLKTPRSSLVVVSRPDVFGRDVS
jgi:hypothetical protein